MSRSRHKDGTLMENDKNNLNGVQRNFSVQYYKGIPLQQIDRGYGNAKARRFTINHTNQNCWIPCKHLETDGTIKPNQDIDYVIMQSKRQFKKAGVTIKFEVQEVNYD
ncbi:hypothetical protein [Oceanobacillus sp. FSL W7-1281]|uniref:hypothetical protein n=1 Tax=Oceanobacillus sp. FSL W7-1281 TaxID=2921698 RepID=UPI0030DC2653